jgi:hypothetical protein
MKNITLESTLETWSFELNDTMFEVQVFNDKGRTIKSVFKENQEDLTEEEENIILNWVKNIDHI